MPPRAASPARLHEPLTVDLLRCALCSTPHLHLPLPHTIHAIHAILSAMIHTGLAISKPLRAIRPGTGRICKSTAPQETQRPRLSPLASRLSSLDSHVLRISRWPARPTGAQALQAPDHSKYSRSNACRLRTRTPSSISTCCYAEA